MLRSLLRALYDPRGRLERIPFAIGMALVALAFWAGFILHSFPDAQWPLALAVIAALGWALVSLVLNRSRSAGFRFWFAALLLLVAGPLFALALLLIPPQRSAG